MVTTAEYVVMLKVYASGPTNPGHIRTCNSDVDVQIWPDSGRPHDKACHRHYKRFVKEITVLVKVFPIKHGPHHADPSLCPYPEGARRADT